MTKIEKSKIFKRENFMIKLLKNGKVIFGELIKKKCLLDENYYNFDKLVERDTRAR